MPDPQTVNLGLYIPLNGADIGTWDVPCNANFNTLDNVLGAASAVTLSNVNVTLSPAQYGCGYINFSGTLTAHVIITFPSVGRTWVVRNDCTNNTTYFISTTSGAGRRPCLPPNEPVMLMSDGSNLDILGLGRVGTYWDFGGSAVPIWVSNSTPVPYLNCDGSTFSAVTYPALAAYLGGTTLPDARGRFRAALNQGTGRLGGASGTNGINADVPLSGGGNQAIGQTNLPAFALTVTDTGHIHGVTDPSHTHNFGGGAVPVASTTTLVDGATTTVPVYGGNATIQANFTGVSIAPAATGISVNSGGIGSYYAPPSYVGGLTLIRAG